MASSRSINVLDLLFLIGFGMISFLPFLGAAPLFDWDEINFAESAREMLVSGNYFQVQINFETFWEKPPLFFWMQALSMKMFGINEFAARLPNAIVGIFTLCALYMQGTRLYNRAFGRLVAGFFLASILPFLYFKSGIIDPTFNFFIFLSLINIIRYEIFNATKASPKALSRAPWKAGFWAGLAVLTKGPVAVLVIFLVYVAYKIFSASRQIPWMALLKFAGLCLLVIASWFGTMILFTEDGVETLQKFISYQIELFSKPVAGHEQPFYYHLLVFVVGCFPMSAFAFRGMFTRPEDYSGRVVKRFMVAWFWVVLILFSIVKTKIAHYSSLLYFPGAFLAAIEFVELVERKRKLSWDNYLLYGLGILLYGVGIALLNIVTANLDVIQTHSASVFVKANLRAEAGWTGWEFMPGLLYGLALVFIFFLMIRKRFFFAFFLQIVATMLYLNTLNAVVAPKVASYTQEAAIEFFQSKANEDAYIMVEGYKSYAHYFYGEVKPFPHPDIPREERGAWMARGAVDKPVYLVTRVDRISDEFENSWFPDFKRLYEKNGFVFMKRDLPQTLN